MVRNMCNAWRYFGQSVLALADTASWRCDTAGGGGDIFRDVCRLLGNGAGRDPESVPGIYAAF